MRTNPNGTDADLAVEPRVAVAATAAEAEAKADEDQGPGARRPEDRGCSEQVDSATLEEWERELSPTIDQWIDGRLVAVPRPPKSAT